MQLKRRSTRAGTTTDELERWFQTGWQFVGRIVIRHTPEQLIRNTGLVPLDEMDIWVQPVPMVTLDFIADLVDRMAEEGGDPAVLGELARIFFNMKLDELRQQVVLAKAAMQQPVQ